ncbi:hypothetical protein R1flu_026974 [Riccia fluitans]|uniref:Uncharacterized protein n=1 Tax=Riccia fluitans TaxID=41844 RepID=A0ABD1XKC4_9MARC
MKQILDADSTRSGTELWIDDTVNKNDDLSEVPQEDVLNYKPPIPAKLEQPPSFKETLETLRQDWYYPSAFPFDGEPCMEELHLKRLTMKGARGDQTQPNSYLQNMPRVYQEVWVKTNFQVKDIKSVNDHA